MEENKPNYYAIIPADVRYDKELPPQAKLLYGEITALANKTGECWASNKYFADVYETTTVTISRLISKLKEKGYITISYECRTHSKEIEKRIIKFNKEVLTKKSIGINKNVKGGINEIVKGGINKNVKENNTSINNTSMNISFIEEKQKKEDIFINPVIENFKKQAKEVFGKNTYLLNAHREKILELNREIDDFPAACEDVFAKLKDINFTEVGYKPSIPWLLKEDNFLKVLNGDFNNRKKKLTPEELEKILDENMKKLAERETM